MSRVRFGAAALAAAGLAACGGVKPQAPGQRTMATGDVQQAALASYVKPGDHDQFYLFYSGGHSGQVFVAGVPSMRHITTIPVFAPYPGTGYGFDEESRRMMGDFTWGDVHHPALSKTDGDYDGRWLFVNDNANNRIARIDLRDMKTHQILGPIPNTSGNHGSSMVTNNSEYALVATRFSVPLEGRYAPVDDYATKYKGAVTGIRIDPKDGTMSVGWQVMTPPFDWDLGATGKGPSDGWAFWTSYNSERAIGKLEANASQRDRDYIAVVNWKAAEAATKAGRTTTVSGVPMIDPAKVPGVMYLLPCGKSPHGVDVDPSGEYVICSGKLQPTSTVYSFQKIQDAIAKQAFTGDEDGIPVLKYEDAMIMEVPVGLGPLHTQFDGKGYAYTSLYVESAIAKWKLPPYAPGTDPKSLVLDKIPVQFNVGHLVVAEGDTRHPQGQWLVAMNKMSKGRHLSTGPSIPESSQLIDINGNKMQMVYEAYTEPEPHFAQLVRASLIKPIEFYPKAESKDPNAVWTPAEAKVTRNAATRTVEAKVLAIRSYFTPSRLQVMEGDTVIIHVTNAEQARDEIHGFGIAAFDRNVVIDPGETKTLRFVARKSGVYPYYCTNFCSALHQEMQGYFEVVPQGQQMALYKGNQGAMAIPGEDGRAPGAAPAAAHAGHGGPQQVAAH
ncbi:MAG TPA: Sec-dependent nitrous-oxide reductase [Gemmatimonadales bacterium]|nr:Sec-dependent nitrous-oxide reductase [Gemmatimonadales bacterium]